MINKADYCIKGLTVSFVWRYRGFFLFHLFLSYPWVITTGPLALLLNNRAQVLIFAVPGLSLFFCSSIWIVQKIPVILFSCMWSQINSFISQWLWSRLAWWHCLRAVFSYLTKQVFAYFWVLIRLTIARIFSHLLLHPLHPPSSPICSKFLFFSTIISFFVIDFNCFSAWLPWVRFKYCSHG